MVLFTPDFGVFFQELAQNNHKDWFHANKKRYENSVKKPFEKLVTQLIERMQEHDPELLITAKDAILRINRDIRFSKDKSPYNLHVTAFISRGGRKDKTFPGFFIRLSPEMVGIMAGCYGPDKNQLRQIRQSILEQTDDWNSILTQSDFKEKFGAIRGEKHKRLVSPFKENVQSIPILANKQFYVVSELPPDLLFQDNLVDELMQYWHGVQGFNQFLQNALSKK